MSEQSLVWRVSSFCADSTCVEAAAVGGALVGLRSSVAPDGGVVLITRPSMGDFLRGIAAGEFDDLA